MHQIYISTPQREGLVDITHELTSLVRKQTWQDGVLVLFCPHTTCALTINEGADPDVARDMTAYLNRLVPQSTSFRHSEGNSDAHIKASLLGASLQLIVEQGRICLGTWQAVYLFEGDGPRTRKVWAQWLQA